MKVCLWKCMFNIFLEMIYWYSGQVTSYLNWVWPWGLDEHLCKMKGVPTSETTVVRMVSRWFPSSFYCSEENSQANIFDKQTWSWDLHQNINIPKMSKKYQGSFFLKNHGISSFLWVTPAGTTWKHLNGLPWWFGSPRVHPERIGSMGNCRSVFF